MKILREEVSCPSCGRIYGAYNRKVCVDCEECSKCCDCKDKKHVEADTFVNYYLF